LPDGIPVYVSPSAQTQQQVSIDLKRVKLRTALRLMLGQAGLEYTVKEGLLIVGQPGSSEFGGMGGGMGMMGGGFR